MSTPLRPIELAALARCRATSRFDPLAKEYGSKPTPEEKAQEELATTVRVPRDVWARLVAARLITAENNRYRLTHAGWAALQGTP